MTDDLRVLLDRASSTPPPLAIDADTVVTLGRGRSRRRLFSRTGAGVLTGAAATATVILITSVLGPTAPAVIGAPATPVVTPAVTASPPPDYTLPVMDPATPYEWESRTRVVDATGAQVTRSLVDYFAAHFPAARVIRHGPEFEPDGFTYRSALVQPGEATFLQVARFAAFLTPYTRSGDPGTPAHEEPLYSLAQGWSTVDGGPTLDHLSGIEVAFDGIGLKQTDLLRLAIFPAGGYRSGTDPAQRGARQGLNGYLVEGCATYQVTNAHEGTDDDREYSFDCTESAGANGERVMAVAMREEYLGGGVSFTYNTVAVYRPDGTAVVVGNTARPGRNGTPGRYGAPSFSLDALTGIALAVPMISFG